MDVTIPAGNYNLYWYWRGKLLFLAISFSFPPFIKSVVLACQACFSCHLYWKQHLFPCKWYISHLRKTLLVIFVGYYGEVIYIIVRPTNHEHKLLGKGGYWPGIAVGLGIKRSLVINLSFWVKSVRRVCFLALGLTLQFTFTKLDTRWSTSRLSFGSPFKVLKRL